MFPTTSLPQNLQQSDFDHLGLDPVFSTPVPQVDDLHAAVEGAPVETAGTWAQSWSVVDITANMSNEQVAGFLGQLQAAKIAALASYRYSYMTGGVSISGNQIKTDSDSQTLLAGAVQLANADPSVTINWKAGNGFVSLTAAQIIGIGVTVGQFVQACFSAEQTHTININQLSTPQAVVEYDITTGWPTNTM